MVSEKYRVLPGPEAFLAPAAALMGVELPDGGGAFVEGEVISEDAAIGVIAERLAGARAPAVCPGPLVLWRWSESAAVMAAAVKELALAAGAKVLLMPDYSARRIDPSAVISPNHPSVTILHNDIDVCLFVGVHSHYANMALRLIRGATSCYTIALCECAPSDEAMVSLGGIGAEKIRAIAERIKSWR